MATAQQPPDPFNSLEPLESSGADAEQKPVSVDNLNERSPSANEEKLMTTNPSLDSNNMDFTGDAPHHLVSSDVVNDYNPIYPANAFSPQAHSFFYGGYENSVGDWEDQSQYVTTVDGLDIGLPGVYVENSSPVYHTGGYGYNAQIPYGPYSSVMAPLPSISGDGHLYPQQFQFPGSYYQQPAPPNLPHLSSSNPTPQADLAMPIDQQGAFPADASNFNTQPFGPRPGYQLSYGHYGDWLISAEGSGSANPLLSPTVSPQPMSAVMPFSQSTMPLTSGMGSQQQNSLYGFGSSISPVDRGYSHSGLPHGSSFGSSFPILGSKERGSTFVDKNRRRGRGSALLCSCNSMLDCLNEQNRGPRANRPKNQMTEQNSSLDNENDSSVVGLDHKLYNGPDFVTEYKDAKFFIIKSYTEDNVHKSIKYGVWASTSSGNRKLDSAYHEAKRKEDPCPVFLFFSVNASAQFCGVAEMIGPVDFEKSVDYWQQDKWSGQFPVKWHIVKDVPNNIFRHIILENNDSKPVTNSRDTQEVKLEQGLEMLSLFKNHEYEVSIFDDFKFYEVREKAMQERKAHHHHHQHHLLCNSAGIVPGASMDHQRNPTAISSDFINHISKNFADAIRLEERSSVDSSAHKSSSLITNIAPKPDELKKPEATTVITSNYQDQQLSKSLAPGVLND